MMCRPRLHHLLAIFNIILPFTVAMTQPVYKIILNSKGYAQFLQYNMDMPALTEFTLCVWVRVTNVDRPQSLFTYIGDYDNRIMHVRLDAGGQQMSIFLNHDTVKSRAAVDFKAGVWRDVCLSYQSDYGAWALYIDAKLVLCEASRMVEGFEIPGEGRLIFGYGRSDEGNPTGLTGEIYGISMIPFSTIERNHTVTKESWSKLNAFGNQFKSKHKLENEYIILGDLKTDEIHTVAPVTMHKKLEDLPFIYTAPQLQDHKKVVSSLPTRIDKTHDKLLNDFPVKKYHRFTNKNKFFNDIYRVQRQFKKEFLSESDTQDLPIVLEYETPPSITASTIDYYGEKNFLQNQDKEMILSEVENPPPPVHDSKVYGQWTNSKFANNVLSYLKNNNFNTNKRNKQVPPTIPVVKLSDSYPYSSAPTYEKVRPSKKYKTIIYIEPRHKIEKRDVNGQQINLKVIDTGISKHVRHYPKYPGLKHVEITNRGETKRQVQDKPHKSTEHFESFELGNTIEVLPATFEEHLVNGPNTFGRHRGNHLMGILSYLQPKGKHNDPIMNTESNQVYSKGFSSPNKWHNVKSYNNDNPPKDATDLDSLFSVNPAVDIGSRNMPTHSKTNPYKQEREKNIEGIINARKLAKEVSKQGTHNYFKVPLLKYRSTHDEPEVKTRNKIAVREIHNEEIAKNKNNFDKHVKLGNALNEQLIMGFNNNEIKNTFLGGDDTVPDINKYRSEWNSQSKIADIPSSLGARVCRNAELYIQEDGSISSSKILFLLVRKNIGIEFIRQNYKKCSTGIMNRKIIIDWAKTPVILFGGAYPEKTRDLCGFF